MKVQGVLACRRHDGCPYGTERGVRHVLLGTANNRLKPDILIHKRMDNRYNLMVLEAKAGAATSVRDKQKLAAMLEVRGTYRYALGVYLHVENKRKRVLETGKVRLSLRWHGSDDVCEMARDVPESVLREIADQPE